ncbi:hypothetical protein BO71DRAFT_406483 [Aspergillus ellipticus CBS 707.79]|uniref:Uncharacterized protein n=1 Tax=Aspergillus ellipticus CBS 707.79 TaxID=1448320 RepID=A0A319E2N2_9EURO|nr:hypothetical protein BO71DRAFT_406483 [Aspergillus ellipticus CBS 707.79]
MADDGSWAINSPSRPASGRALASIVVALAARVRQDLDSRRPAASQSVPANRHYGALSIDSTCGFVRFARSSILDGVQIPSSEPRGPIVAPIGMARAYRAVNREDHELSQISFSRMIKAYIRYSLDTSQVSWLHEPPAGQGRSTSVHNALCKHGKAERIC